MKKTFCRLLLLTMLLCMVTGCGAQTGSENTPPAPQEILEQQVSTDEKTGADNSAESTEEIKAGGKAAAEETTDVSEDPPPVTTADEQHPIRYENTYWTAVKYVSFTCDCEDHQDSPCLDLPAPKTEDRVEWWLDLFLFADGSVLLRDVAGDCYTGMAMEGTWKTDEAGQLKIVSALNLSTGVEPEEGFLPFLRLVDGDDPDETGLAGMLALDYFGGLIYFQQASMPEKDFHLCMADLQGDWTMVSLEIKGYVSDGRSEGLLSSVSFEESAHGVEAVYTKLSRYSGIDEEFRASVRYREEPLYYGCGNEGWSVEFKPQILEQDEGTRFFATLLDRDTLLLQRCFSIDGGPAVCYETYRRDSEASDAISIQKSLDERRAQAPEKTMLCVGVDQLAPQSPGVDQLMSVVPLTEADAPNSFVLICPIFAGVRVVWDGEVIHETQLTYRQSELLLLDIPEAPGVCHLEISPDLESWYTWTVSEETISEPGWINILYPG